MIFPTSRRFTFPALIPGATYRISVPEENGTVLKKEFRVEVGKTQDLGDITLSRTLNLVQQTQVGGCG